MISIREDTLEVWENDFEDFNYDFRRYTFALCKAYGLYPHIDGAVLRLVHASWTNSLASWRAGVVNAATQRLSQLKIAALLLDALASSKWIAEFDAFDIESETLDYSAGGDPSEYEEIRLDIFNGAEEFLALQFCKAVINVIEEARVDCQMPFQYRMTPDMEKDIIFYLKSNFRNPISTFLILKALYLRDLRL